MGKNTKWNPPNGQLVRRSQNHKKAGFGHGIIQGHCLDMRFSCPVHPRAQQIKKKIRAILILIFGSIFFNTAPNFDMRPSGPGTVWCLLNLSMARNFFWVRVGLTWNQTGLGAPARARYEATRDGVRAPQGRPQAQVPDPHQTVFLPLGMNQIRFRHAVLCLPYQLGRCGSEKNWSPG